MTQWGRICFVQVQSNESDMLKGCFTQGHLNATFSPFEVSLSAAHEFKHVQVLIFHSCVKKKVNKKSLRRSMSSWENDWKWKIVLDFGNNNKQKHLPTTSTQDLSKHWNCLLCSLLYVWVETVSCCFQGQDFQEWTSTHLYKWVSRHLISFLATQTLASYIFEITLNWI